MMKYDKYKPTGLEWLGNVPEEWEIKRFKDIFLVSQGLQISRSLRYFKPKEGSVKYITIPSIEGKVDEHIDKPLGNVLCKLSDFLVVRTGSGVGKILFNVEGAFHNNFFKASIYQRINRRYAFHILTSPQIQYLMRVYAGLTAIPDLNHSAFYSIFCTFPSVETQNIIAQYLDAKTQAIDKKINLLIIKTEYYKELRKSIINDAVCKGLDKNIKLKESGIEWIGKIPQHWLIVRGKNLFNEYAKSKITASEGNSEGKYKFFTSSNEQSKWLDYFQNDKEAILFSTGGCVGVNYCDKEYSYSTDCWAIFGNKKTFLKYFAYYFETIINEIQQKGLKGSSLEHLQKDFIKLSEIVLPPKEEQTAIANYLDDKTQKIDAIVSNIGKQIETLKELRKTLINDVVTGKLKVTNN